MHSLITGRSLALEQKKIKNAIISPKLPFHIAQRYKNSFVKKSQIGKR